MSGHRRRVCMMMNRLRVAVMMVRMLSLVLLEAHQALASIQIRTAPEVVGVLVNMGVHVAMEMHTAIHRRGFVMMLIRIQHLLDVLRLLLAGALLLQQACMILQLLVQLLAGRLEQIRHGFQHGARARGQTVLTVLQARALLDSSSRFERQVARQVQVTRTAREIVPVSR